MKIHITLVLTEDHHIIETKVRSKVTVHS